MADITTQYVNAVTKTQEATWTACQAWFGQLQEFIPSVFEPAANGIPNPVETFDRGFQGVEKALHIQRDFFHEIADAYTPLVDSTVNRVTDTVGRMTTAAERLVPTPDAATTDTASATKRRSAKS